MSVNKVILVGHLGKDPELRFTPNQTAVGNFTLATNERRKDATGQWADHTEWHNIVVWGKTAENCNKFIKKGRQVYIEGRIQTRKWKDKEGRDRYTTEVIGDTVQFLGGTGKGTGSGMMVEQSVDSMQSSSNEGFGLENNPILASIAPADSIASGGGAGSATSQSSKAAFDDDDIPF